MGTGWYPTFPAALYLAGARHVKTVDVQRLLKPRLTLAMVERLGAHVDLIARTARAPAGEVAERQARLLAGLRRGDSIESATGGAIEYHAPSDASRTGLPASSLDVVFSNSVLEHVPEAVIEACFVEAMRIVVPGGVVFHSVNCGDHYAYTDRSIDQLHYLQYSDEAWAKWNNAFLYQNRLRAIDFTRMAKRAGFAIELDTSKPRPHRLERLARMRIDPRFSRYSPEQLAITSIDFIGRKPPVVRASAATPLQASPAI
jgi:SAM-dependent methyltransferase